MLHGMRIISQSLFELQLITSCMKVVSVTPAQYFKARRGIANGIVYAGGGLGGTVISFILNALLENVGIAWTFRILGFMIIITGLPAAYLIKERTAIQATQVVEWYVLPYINIFKANNFLTKRAGVYSVISVSLCFSPWVQLAHSHSSSRPSSSHSTQTPLDFHPALAQV